MPRAPLSDLYYRLLSGSWWYVTGLAAGSYLVANLIFAGLYMLDPGSLTTEGFGFSDAFFFSVQTISTIGYGVISPATPYANMLVTVEAMLGLFGFALVTGLIFAKFGRPNARVMFSKNLVITQRYGKPCLMFRVANARSNEVVEASVHVACLKTDISPEGHRMRRIYDLALLRDSQPLFALSWLVIHEIDDASPLSGLTAEEMGNDFVMLIVTLTGIDGTFASTVHARQLYVYADVAWGYRFVDVITTDTGGAVTIDYRKFDEIEVDPAWTGEVVAAAPPADR